MSTELRIPKLGMSMEEGLLSEWLVGDGDEVAEGTPLYAIENDKATQEVESPASGKLTIIAQPGESYPVGEIIGRID